MATVLEYFKKRFPSAERYTSSGIDVSGHQAPSVVADLLMDGHRFDWVVTKYTEGASFAEDAAIQQRADTLTAGLAHGCYHWVSYRTSPSFEFFNFKAHCEKVGVPQPTAALPVSIWLDAEDPNHSRHVVSGLNYTAYTLELAVRIEQEYQMPVGIYTASWWAEGRLDDRLSSFPLWVAEYENGGGVWRSYTEPVIPSAWHGKLPMVWQWASVSSELGNLDLNAADMSQPVERPTARQFDTQREEAPKPIVRTRPKDLKGDGSMHVLQDDNQTLYLVRDDKKILLSDALSEIMDDASVTPTMPIETANELYSAGLTSIPWVRSGYLALGVIPWEPNRNPSAPDYWQDRS